MVAYSIQYSTALDALNLPFVQRMQTVTRDQFNYLQTEMDFFVTNL